MLVVVHRIGDGVMLDGDVQAFVTGERKHRRCVKRDRLLDDIRIAGTSNMLLMEPKEILNASRDSARWFASESALPAVSRSRNTRVTARWRTAVTDRERDEPSAYSRGCSVPKYSLSSRSDSSSAP